jgi:hypothetical protein
MTEVQNGNVQKSEIPVCLKEYSTQCLSISTFKCLGICLSETFGLGFHLTFGFFRFHFKHVVCDLSNMCEDINKKEVGLWRKKSLSGPSPI